MESGYILLLNWNGWADTCLCMESLLALSGPKPRILLCDNASTDGSVEHIRRWARGEAPCDHHDLPLPLPMPARRPLRLAELSREEAERGAGPEDADIWLIHTGANLGFAGGCNVGLRFALARGDADYVWLLNTDTVVEPEALQALLCRARLQPDIGMVGSTLRYYHRPGIVQALGGGTFSPRRAATHHIGEGLAWQPPDKARCTLVEQEMAYVVGASMLVTRRMLEQVGLLHEDYFVYYEEIDWAERARRATPPLKLAYAPQSVVFHKEGATLGTSARSLPSLRWLSRNRLRFIKRFHPARLLHTRWLTCVDAVKLCLKGRPDGAWVLLKAALGPVCVQPWKGSCP